MKNKILLLTLTALTASGLRSQADDINSILSQWNVITSGDLKNVNDIEGRAYVGGNVTMPNAFQVATGRDGKGFPISSSSVSLAVRGNIIGGGDIHVEAGRAVVGGSIQGSRKLLMNGGGTVTQGNPAALPASPVSQVTSASQYWSTLAANCGTTVTSNGRLNFNAGAGQSVFNISASQMLNQGYQGFSLTTLPGAGNIIINISGSSFNAQTSIFDSSWTSWTQNHVIFNFYEATSLNLSDWINGYVIAPNASVKTGNNFNGGVMAKDLYVNSEVHLPNDTNYWRGLPNPPTSDAPIGAVPEASTVFSGVTALAVLIGGFISQKRKKSAAQA